MIGMPLSIARSCTRQIFCDCTTDKRPAQDGEVVGEHGDAPAVHLAEAGDDAVARVAL